MNDALKVLIIDRSNLAMRHLSIQLQDVCECSITMSNDPTDATSKVSSGSFDLILSEWEFGESTVEPLMQMRKRRGDWRNICFILYTANHSEVVSRQALDLGANDVLFKPMNREFLKQRLTNFFPHLFAVEESPGEVATPPPAKTASVDIRGKLDKLPNLAPLPTVTQQILETTEDDKSSARDLGEVIRKDQTLTARILKIVNSAYYGYFRKIGNVDRAIVILGFEEVKNITLAASLIQYYGASNTETFDRKEFWVHSLAVAYISKALSANKSNVQPEDAFAAGLLHDIGKVILDQLAPKAFEQAVQISRQKEHSLLEICTVNFDIDHPEIGGIIAENWKFPQRLVECIQLHHTPAAAGKSALLTHLVHTANYFAHVHQIGDSGNAFTEPLYEGSKKMFCKEDQTLEELWDSLEIDVAAIKDML